MCFDATATPPPAPRRAYDAQVERVTLTASDGTALAATRATTSAPAAPGVVVLPDVRGLHRYYEQLAEELARAGAHAVAIDFYGRTAGGQWRPDDFDYAPHRAAADDTTVAADVDAALHHLADSGVDARYVLGFCFGGRAALMQASRGDVRGAIAFYGWPTREDDGASPVTEAAAGRVRAPVLAIFGGADDKIPAADRRAYADALAAAGVAHDIVVFDDAPHSFFDRHMSAHQDACADSWRRILHFLETGAPS